MEAIEYLHLGGQGRGCQGSDNDGGLHFGSDKSNYVCNCLFVEGQKKFGRNILEWSLSTFEKSTHAQ